MSSPLQQEPELLQISEIRYRRLFESARDGIVILDAITRKITDVNPFMVELLGYSRDEFVGKELWEIGLLRDSHASAVAFREIQEKGYIRYEDLPLQTKDGQTRPVEFVSNIYDENGHSVIQCNIRDISKRKHAEAVGHESKRFLQSTLDALTSHIAVLDETGEIIAVNRAWERFAEENDGSPIACGVGANYLEACDKAEGDWLDGAVDVARGIREVIAGKRPIFRLEYPCHSPNEQRWFNLRVTRFDDATPVRVVVSHENITERRRAEHTVKISEANLAKSQEMAHLGSWELDLTNLDDINANPLRWSEELFRIFGYEPGDLEVTNENFFRAVHPDDRERVWATMAHAIRTNQPYNIDHLIILPDGSERIIHSQAEIVRDEVFGAARKMTGIGQDITERKQIEAALLQSEAWFRTAITEAPVPIMIHREDGKVLQISKGWTNYSGYDLDDIPTIADWTDRAYGDQSSQAHEHIKTLYQIKQTRNQGEWTIKAKNGEERIWAFVSTPLGTFGDDQRVIINTAFDITERKQAEQELQASEARKSAILETALDCIIVIDAQSRILEWNPASEKTFGYARDEVMGKLLPALIIPESLRAAHFAGMENYLATGEGPLLGRHVEVSGLRKNGEEFPVELAITRIESEDIPVFTAYLRDITERKLTEDKLRESEARLNNAQRIAHLGSWNWEISTDKLHWSDEVFHLFGLVPQKLGANYAAFEKGVHPEDRAKVNLAVQDALAGKAPYNIEHRILRKDGSEIVVQQQGEVSFDETGKAYRMTGTVLDITERKQAEQKLQESNEKFQLLVNNITDTFWIRSPDMREQIYLSPSFKQMWGVPAEDQYAAPHIWSEMVFPEDRARTQEAFSALMQDTPSISIEYRIKQPDGEVRWVHSRGYQVRNDAGELIRLAGIVSDITERKQVEEELRASEERFQSIVTNVPGMVYQFILQPDGSIELPFVSEGCRELYDLEPDEVQRNPNVVIDLVHPDDRAEFDRSILVSAQTLLPWIWEGRYQHASGQITWTQGASRPRRLSNGGTLWDGVLLDITARKEAEIERDRFFTLSLDMLGISGEDGYFKRLNPAFEATLGFSNAELMAVPFLEFVHPDDHAITREGAARLKRGLPVTNFENRYRCRDGSYKWLHWTVAPFENLWYCVARDVTGIKQGEVALQNANEELERRVEKRTAELERAKAQADMANQAKSEFLSRMSHELRTPLNAILGFGQLLSKQDFAPAQKERVQHILKAGRHLLGLINEVLEISRIEAGQMLLSLEPVHVGKTVQEVFSLLRPLAAEHGIELQGDDSPDLEAYVWADLQRLRQVLLNLCSNAIKYNRPQGTITVTCQTISGISSPMNPSPANLLQINVTDTGMGMTPAAQAQLFVPFMRMGAEHTTIEGTGLGLALSLSIMHAMNGTIGVESTVGVESTFWLQLPLTPAPLSVAEEALGQTVMMDVEAATASATRYTLLYIEDNLSNLQLIEAVVADEPIYALISTMQGQMGLDLARQHRPDLILLDLNLPDLPGDQVLAQLKSNPSTADIPVVMLSAVAVKSEIQRLLAAGATAYLTKPLDVALFLDTLDNILQPPQGSI